MANNKEKLRKWIDVDNMIKYTEGTYKGCIDYKSNIGRYVKFKYGDIEGELKIIDYINKKIVVEYNGVIQKPISANSFKNGKIGVIFNIGGITKEDIINQRFNRVGEKKINKYGVEIKIIEYKSEEDITVVYNDDIKTATKTTYREFRKENRLITPYDRTICNIGYLGVGNYKATEIIDGVVRPTKEYDAWRSMIRRCYADLKQHKSYKGCEVCEEWHNFQNFAKWYEENYYEVKGERMQVDKDIKFKGNKTYSPNNCIIVPNRLNCLFIKSTDKRGECPIGVYLHKGRYIAQCHVTELSRQYTIGSYDSPTEAFYAYKDFKEKYINKVAEEYKDLIPKNVYDCIVNYKIDIND